MSNHYYVCNTWYLNRHATTCLIHKIMFKTTSRPIFHDHKYLLYDSIPVHLNAPVFKNSEASKVTELRSQETVFVFLNAAVETKNLECALSTQQGTCLSCIFFCFVFLGELWDRLAWKHKAGTVGTRTNAGVMFPVTCRWTLMWRPAVK